ncbi:MAG: hypothetical protein ABIT58_09315 [Ferruginibacter sp.]
MIIKNRIYHIFLFIIFCADRNCAAAQTVEIKTDKNQILIGERIHYDLQITLPSEGYSIKFGIPDSLPHFETIENGNFDTISTNGATELRRKFVFTSFDSGSWYIPAMPVTLQINNEPKKFMTDSVLINVGYSPADSTGTLRDIKPIMEMKIKDYFWLYVIGAILTLIIIGFLIYNYYKNRASKPLPVLHSALSPYQEAMKELEVISKYELANGAQTKEYHTQLGSIFKRYFSRIVGNNFLNKTTGELLLQMNQQEVSSGVITSMAQILRIADAVKFAKYIPAVQESELSHAELKLAIDGIEKNKQNKNQA